MQFFPYAQEINGVSALGGVALGTAGQKTVIDKLEKNNDVISAGNAKGNDFLKQLNANLAAMGIEPISVAAESGQKSLPSGVRVLEPNSGTLKREDINALRDSLKKRGISDSNLEKLEQLLSSGQPLSMGGIVNALFERSRTTPGLSEEESMHLGSALRKFGFSQEETEELTAMMNEGKGMAAMQRINKRIGTMDDNAAVTLDAKELQSLTRGLELSESATLKTLAMLKGNAELAANKEGLTALLAHANKEFAAKEEGLKAVAKELQNAVAETLQAAKLREKSDPVSDTRGNKRTARSEALMRDKLTAKSNQLGPEAMAARHRQLAAEATDDDTARDTAYDRQQEERQADHKKFAAAQVKNDTRDAAVSTTNTTNKKADFDPLLAKMTPEGVFSQPAEQQAARVDTAVAGRNFQQDIFAQVERSMLRELRDGSHQITLRLDPLELGQLTVQLTVFKGEVRALIRTENPETTAALSEQMSQLKASLEEQGLKVAELDVQTQLRDDSSTQQWDTTAGHNKEQELREHARSAELAKLRRGAGNTLAQDMQSIDMRAENAASGLHIIM